jgi:hypothetical protein
MKLTDVELRFTEEKLEKAFTELLGQIFEQAENFKKNNS